MYMSFCILYSIIILIDEMMAKREVLHIKPCLQKTKQKHFYYKESPMQFIIGITISALNGIKEHFTLSSKRRKTNNISAVVYLEA
jgi:hypothetical protein